MIQPEEPQRPRHAALYLDFRNIQPVSDICITEALPCQPVNREQHSCLFPEDTHVFSSASIMASSDEEIWSKSLTLAARNIPWSMYTGVKEVRGPVHHRREFR
jgi:hypothetical protein